MLRPLKIVLLMGLLAVGLRSARAFTPGGPIGNGGDSWQVPVIGYGLPGDILAPKNIGEEYRWNIPVLYYSCDQNFLEYFGSNGVAAVDQAMAILNNITNVSLYNPDLSGDFPFEARQQNYDAEAMSLLDLKSYVLSLMVEQLGLASPDRYVWTLHDRVHVGSAACPVGMQYIVVKRNFDPITFEPSSYVNGTLYSYQIAEGCTGPSPLALASPFNVDPLAFTFTPVASGGFGVGDYYINLTVDDVAGLRYLIRTNNMNFEGSGPGTSIITTNLTTPTPLVTSDLALFSARAPVNDPGTLQALYPNLVITSSSNYLVNLITSNVVAFYTNFPSPFSNAPALLVIQTNYVTNVVASLWKHTFGNIVTNEFRTNALGAILETNIVANVFTNLLAGPSLLQTLDFKVLSDRLPVTDPATLQGLYPNLIILNSTNYFTNMVTSSVIAFYTNIISPFSNAPAVLVIQTNYTTNGVFPLWAYTLGNVITNEFHTNALGAILETNIVANVFTNLLAGPTLMQTLDLKVLSDRLPVTPPAALQTLYPNLVILNSTNYFTNQVTSSVIAFYTNFPGAASNTPASLVIFTNYTTNGVFSLWAHTLGNVVTNEFRTNAFGGVLETNVVATIVTNQLGGPGLLTTLDLKVLSDRLPITPPATLQALYPGLIINSFTNYFQNVSTSVVVAFYTNFAGSPPNTPATLIIQTNVTPNIVLPFWKYDLGNVVTNEIHTNALGYILTTNVVAGFVTNTGPNQLTTLDFKTFLDLLPVTDPATLVSLYPNLNITSVTTNLVITNVSSIASFQTNYPWMPAGFPSATVFTIQNQLVFSSRYAYTFDNVVTNHFFTNWPQIVRTNDLTYSPQSVPPNYFLQTNHISAVTNRSGGGDFYILPPGVVGYVFIPGLVITNKSSVTNIGQVISIASNKIRYTEIVNFFTNYSYAVYEIRIGTTTNVTLKATTNNLEGDFYLGMPGIAVTQPPIATNVIITTNLVVVSTVPGGPPATTNIFGQFYTRSIITFFTNHTFVTYSNSIQLTTNVTFTVTSNNLEGDFYLSSPFIAVTQPPIATNVLGATNLLVQSFIPPNASNVDGQSYTRSLVSFFTNHTFVTYQMGIALTTNITLTTTSNNLEGDFYLGSPAIAVTQLPIATNVFVSTNLSVLSFVPPGVSNVDGQSYSRSLITYFTNHTFVTYQFGIALTTNITLTFNSNNFEGDFYLSSPNVYVKQPPIATNSAASTNTFVISFTPPGVTNIDGQLYTRSLITYFTNHTFATFPINFQDGQGAAFLRQGIDKMTFVRRDFDSLLGKFFSPATNYYTLLSITNSTLVPQSIRRIVTAPDILFTARDIPAPVNPALGIFTAARSINPNQNNILPGLAGPGTIEPQVTFTFNKVAPAYWNSSATFLDEPGAFLFIWGSFDGTTNPPVVYPSGTSLANLENMVLMQVTASPPPGNISVAYNYVLTGAGGQTPYTWVDAYSTNSANLPPGLTLSTAGVIFGLPTTAGTFDFTVRMTDSAARYVDQPLSITISP